MLLKDEVYQLKTEVEQLEEALNILKNPPKYQPPIGTNSILDYLKSEFSAIEDEKERKQKLTITEKLLQKSKQTLAGKEKELTELETQCQQIEKELDELGAEVVKAQKEFESKLNQFKQAAKEKLHTYYLLHGNVMYFDTRLTPNELDSPVFYKDQGRWVISSKRFTQPALAD